MIEARHLSKSYPVRHGMNRVLDDISITFNDSENMGILGRNGSGKSTLLRLLAGIEQADRGEVIRSGRISWPLGFGGGFNGSLTGEENCRFVARIYGADVRRVTRFAYDFSELRQYFRMPVRTYSSGMRSRLAFGLSMAIDFNIYLIDEVTAVGDKPFQAKCREAFRERRERSAVIIVSHNLATIRQYSERCAVLSHGKLQICDSINEAREIYEAA